ncbi:hypothetical protein FQN50_003008 [Emmonsiellopsis sp. PD_5]|nr:hypothetical protein FQN50_003008 [Emmonsiellopsis sp. PD_5]
MSINRACLFRALLLPNPTDWHFLRSIIPVPVDDATFAQYNREAVKDALLSPEAYIKFRRDRFRAIEHSIELSERMGHQYLVTNEQILEIVDTYMLPYPIYPLSEPPGLQPIVYYRILCLQEIPVYRLDPELKRNIDAVIYAYRTRRLQFNPGRVTFWWRGQLVEDLVFQTEWSFDYDHAFFEYRRVLGDGVLWRERIIPLGQMYQLIEAPR